MKKSKLQSRKDYDGTLYVKDKEIKYRITNSKRLADDIFEFHVCYYNEDGSYSVQTCCDNKITLSFEVIKETYFKMIENQKLYTSTNDSDE